MPLRSSLRMAGPDDAAAIGAIYAPYVVETEISFESDPPDADEMRSRIERTLRQHPWLVAEADGELLGYAYAGVHSPRDAYRWSTDVSVYLRRDAFRRGLGRRLYLGLFDLLRAQGYVHAYAGVTLPNPGSAGLHEAMGFRPVGVYEAVGHKNGRWLDVGWWALELNPPPAVPSEPLPWTALPADVVDAALRA